MLVLDIVWVNYLLITALLAFFASFGSGKVVQQVERQFSQFITIAQHLYSLIKYFSSQGVIINESSLQWLLMCFRKQQPNLEAWKTFSFLPYLKQLFLRICRYSAYIQSIFEDQSKILKVLAHGQGRQERRFIMEAIYNLNYFSDFLFLRKSLEQYILLTSAIYQLQKEMAETGEQISVLPITINYLLQCKQKNHSRQENK